MCVDAPLEGGERLRPEAVEIGAQRVERLGIERVHAARAGGAVGDQMRLLQHAKVLRNRGPADWQRAGNLADRKRAVDQARENRAPRRVAERVELRFMVSIHLP